MAAQSPIRDSERANFNFFLKLPDYDPTLLQLPLGDAELDQLVSMHLAAEAARDGERIRDVDVVQGIFTPQTPARKPGSTAAKSCPSTLDTKCKRNPGNACGAKACTAMAGPRSLPPMPMCTTSVKPPARETTPITRSSASDGRGSPDATTRSP